MAAQNLTSSIETSAIFTPEDLRDPLGVWGGRLGVTGTGTGGIKVSFQVPAELKAAYVFTCYDATMASLTGTAGQPNGKIRLLTNWPNIDPDAGVQGFSSLLVFAIALNTNFTSPIAGPNQEIIKPNQRLMILYDPRPIGGDMPIIEMELGENILAATYSFECWGYFWDRAVMQVPGGLRHPGAS